jgi:hypothetical protein
VCVYICYAHTTCIPTFHDARAGIAEVDHELLKERVFQTLDGHTRIYCMPFAPANSPHFRRNSAATEDDSRGTKPPMLGHQRTEPMRRAHVLYCAQCSICLGMVCRTRCATTTASSERLDSVGSSRVLACDWSGARGGCRRVFGGALELSTAIVLQIGGSRRVMENALRSNKSSGAGLGIAGIFARREPPSLAPLCA